MEVKERLPPCQYRYFVLQCSLLLTRWRNIRPFYTTFVLKIQKRSRFGPALPPSPLVVATPLNNIVYCHLSFVKTFAKSKLDFIMRSTFTVLSCLFPMKMIMWYGFLALFNVSGFWLSLLESSKYVLTVDDLIYYLEFIEPSSS